jgi:hypothetical protein
MIYGSHRTTQAHKQKSMHDKSTIDIDGLTAQVIACVR